MKTALMQPYFVPYLGYFQLIDCVDQFVLYDDVQYLKGGWVNRNRILLNGKPAYITLPIEADSVSLHINQRKLSLSQYEKGKRKILGQLQQAYRRTPHFTATIELVESILNYESANMADFLFNSLQTICDYLGISTALLLSSQASSDTADLSDQDRVVAICQSINTDCYINAIGGQTLYSADVFTQHNLELKFIRMGEITYPQTTGGFEPHLSMIDVMMCSSVDSIQSMLKQYTLVPGT